MSKTKNLIKNSIYSSVEFYINKLLRKARFDKTITNATVSEIVDSTSIKVQFYGKEYVVGVNDSTDYSVNDKINVIVPQNNFSKLYIENDAISGSGGYNDEAAQDAVGNILTDSDTIDFTYTDATPTISASVKKQMSIDSDSSGLKLSGDSSSVGNNKFYGTDGSGTKGFYDAVLGISSSTDGTLVLFDGTGGKTLKQGIVLNKHLMSGNWSSSDLTVTDFDDYHLIAIQFDGANGLALAYKKDGYLYGVGGNSTGNNQYLIAAQITYSGTTLTWGGTRAIVQYSSSGHSAGSSPAVTNIFGIC